MKIKKKVPQTYKIEVLTFERKRVLKVPEEALEFLCGCVWHSKPTKPSYPIKLKPPGSLPRDTEVKQFDANRRILLLLG